MSSTSRSPRRRARAVAGAAVTALVSATALTAGVSDAGAAESAPAPGITLPAGFHATVFASASKIYDPDDITELDGNVWVGYSNGVGTMGEPSPSGGIDSTVVEYSLQGKIVGRWNVIGKVDGLGADPSRHAVIATVNEDGNSSLYTIQPLHNGHAVIRYFHYNGNPLPHGGGTDSVVVRDGKIYISASNPSANASGAFTGPALYTASLDGATATLTPALMGDSTATNAMTGKQVTLNLSDPDSSEVVPWSEGRFGGDVMLDSQGDSQLIFLHHPGTQHQTATVLNLSTQVDDTAFVTEPCGTLIVVDNKADRILAITGPFKPGEVFDAVPTDSTTIPGNLATTDLNTGQVTAFGSGFANPHGLLFVSPDDQNQQ